MKLEPTDRALILTPYYGGIDPDHHKGVGELLRLGWLEATVHNCGLVDHARAALAGMALRDEHGFDVVLWIDSDVVFGVHQAVSIVRRARELDAMVGAPVIIKKIGGPLMCIGIEEGSELVIGDDGSPVRCLGVPFGFTAMPMHWLRKVCESVGPSTGPGGMQVWPAFQCIRAHDAATGPETGTYMSEDYSFCQRYRDLGGSVYLDPSVRVGHKGSYTWTIEDLFWGLPEVDRFRVRVGPNQALSVIDEAAESLPPEPVTCRTIATD